MAEPRLVFEHVTKSFRDRTVPRTLRDAIASTLAMLSGRAEPERSHFVALDDVSFSIFPGEAVGIIGHNGAGKTTSLKLAAGVFRPDSGAVHVRGPTASMIELSAGFHPDLSGRENIFLNAALLGLRRKEIQHLLPRIIEFSGVEAFIDAPLRVYSSGMEVRLGFAVAAHVPANLMLVDEVLAVGDLDFRTRCIDRMAERRREGVSVLFVSHHLSVLQRFCDRVIVLDHGRKVLEGDPVETVDGYRRRIMAAPGGPMKSPVRTVRRGTGQVRISQVEIRGTGEDGEVRFGEPFTLRMHLEASPGTPAPTLGVIFHSIEGAHLTESQSPGDAPGREPLPGDCDVAVSFERMSLLPGAYQVSVYALNREGHSDWDYQDKIYRVAVHGDRPPGEMGVAALRATWDRP